MYILCVCDIYIYIHSVVKRMFHEGSSDDDEFPAGEAGYFRVFTGRPGLIRDSLKKNAIHMDLMVI